MLSFTLYKAKHIHVFYNLHKTVELTAIVFIIQSVQMAFKEMDVREFVKTAACIHVMTSLEHVKVDANCFTITVGIPLYKIASLRYTSKHISSISQEITLAGEYHTYLQDVCVRGLKMTHFEGHIQLKKQ